MSFIQKKLSDSERDSLNVKSVQGSRLTGTVQENKNIFDRLVELLTERYNELVEELVASTAAGQIGADLADVVEKNVQGILTKLDTDIKNRYTKEEISALLGSGTNDLVQDFSIDLNTGVITVTKKDGTSQTWDTQIEKIPASFAFIEEGGKYYLQVTNEDGTSTRTDVTALMNHYSFDNSNEVAFTVTGDGPEKRVSASIRANSIGIEKLSLSVVAQLEGYVSSAAQSAAAAELSKEAAQTAQTTAAESAATATSAAGQSSQSAEEAHTSERASRSFAKGDTNTRVGEETDNAEYYSGLARTRAESADASKTAAESAKAAAEAAKTTAETAAETATQKANEATTAKTAAETAAASALESKNAASTSATASALSEQQAAASSEAAGISAINAEEYAIDSKSWTVGGTGNRKGEDTDNAKYYARQSSEYASEASSFRSMAEDAKTAAETAKATTETAVATAVQKATEAATAKTAAETARDAAAGSATAAESAKTAAETAKASAEASAATAIEKATEASASAAAAAESETNAGSTLTSATAQADRAKTEADRAKTEADRAAEIVGGDFATKTEVETAKNAAISAAATDAATKANTAKTEAISTASADATAKASAAKAEAVKEAATAAENKVTTHNAAADAHATLFAGKVDKVTGKGLSANDYTTAEKTKLEGIAESANNYVHPATPGSKHIPSGGASGQVLGWSADGTATWQDAPKFVTATIPAGRMRGDIDGDGKITQADETILSNHLNGTQVITDAMQLLCADLQGDGSVDGSDDQAIYSIMRDYSSPARYGPEITGNWTNEGDFYYTDIAVSGITTTTSAIVAVLGAFSDDVFVRAECVSGGVRIYTKYCPIEDAACIISYAAGNGTAIIQKTIDMNEMLSPYLPLSGGTMTGRLIVESPVVAGRGGARNIYTTTDGTLPEGAADGDICIVL